MPSPPANQRLDLIDALRGFAALWVFLYHIWNVLHPWANSQAAPIVWDSTRPWDYWLSFFLFQYGYYGVSIFFVVSGFCIHLPQARKHARTGCDGLKREAFFQRRFWRLYPAYFVGLFVASLSLAVMRFMEYRAGGWPLPLPDHFYEEAFGVDKIACNALFLVPFYETAQDLNSVLWTLVFEVQFYALYPLLLLLIRRIGVLPIGVLLLAAEVVLHPTPINQSNFMEHRPWDYFFLAKYFEWFLGVVAAEWIVNRKSLGQPLTITGFALSLAYGLGCIFFPELWPYRDIAVACATFFLLLWMLPHSTDNPVPPHFLLRTFIWLGLFSYSLYLLHIPLLRIIYAGNTLLAEAWGHPSWERWLILDSIPIVILAAWGFYWLFERPFLKGK